MIASSYTYRASGGPIPLHRYRKRAKSPREKRAESVAALAEKIAVPKAAVSGVTAAPDAWSAEIVALPRQRFIDPDPWREVAYASELDARRDIAAMLARPLGGLPDEDLGFIAALVSRTLDKAEIRAAIRERFQPSPKGAPPC